MNEFFLLRELRMQSTEKIAFRSYPLYEKDGAPVKYALIFKCQGYLGNAPSDPEAY